MKSKKLLVLGLLTTLAVTGCNQNKEEKPDDSKDDQGQTETKKVESVSLNKTTLELEEESSETLIATINPSDAVNKGLKWESSDEDVAMVNGLGKVRALKAGKATITVSSLEDSSKKATCEVTVTAKDRTVHVTGVELNVTQLSLDKGDKEVLRANVLPLTATNKEVTWATSNAEVATVNETGLVTGVTKGTATITVTSVDNTEAKATCVVTVVDDYVAVEKVTISSTDEHFKVEEGVKKLELQDVDRPLGQLTVSVKGLNDDNEEIDPTNPRVIWSVMSGADVVTVSATGQVTALKVGSAVVRATSEADSSKYDEVQITVIAESEKDHTVHVTSIEWGANLPESINLGAEASVSVTVNPSNTNYTLINFSLAEGDSELVTLTKLANNVCKLTAKQTVGQITLTATADDQENSPAPIQATINIVDPVTHVSEIKLDNSLTDLVLFKGDNLDLVAGGKFQVLPENASNKSVVYSSSNEDHVLVSSSGKLTAVAAGTSEITIQSVQDSTVTAKFTVTVKNVQVDTIEGVPASKTLEKGNTFTLEPVVNYKDGFKGTDVTYQSSDASIVKVNENGVLTALKTGEATITVTAAPANAGDPEVKVTCAVTVVDTKPILSSLVKPTSLLRYEQKTTVENMTSTTDVYKQTTTDKGAFFEGTEDELIYKVGDKGLFKFNPRVEARYNGEDEDRAYDGEVLLTKTLQVKNGDNYIAADTADYSLEDNGVKFNSSAVGKQFKLSVTPAESDAYNIASNIGTSTIEFKVVKGYNAYTLADLSLFSNTNIYGLGTKYPIDWEAYRHDNGVTASVSDANDGIVLHNNIRVSSDVIPAAGKFTKDYWDAYLATSSGQSDFDTWKSTIGFASDAAAKEALYDSPKDYLNIFARFTYATDDNFTLEGNFFSIDMSDLKPIVKDYDQGDTLCDFQSGDGSHGQLFGINRDHYDLITAGQVVDQFHFKNFELIGNAGIDSDNLAKVKLAKGGFMGFTISAAQVNFTNVISQKTFISVMSEVWNDVGYEKTGLNVDRMKAFNSYNGVFYFWGSKNNVFSNSWFAEAGGPLVFLDECKKADGTDWEVGNTEFYPVEAEATDVYFNNPLSGTEPWFTSHDGSQSLVQNYLVDGGDPTVEAVPAQGLPGGWIGKIGYGMYGGGLETARTITGKNGDDKFINFIAAVVNAHHFGDNVYGQLNGHFNIHNADGEGSLDLAKTAKNEYYQPTQLAPEMAPIIITGSTGGVAYISATGSPVGCDPEVAADQQNMAALATSSYISYYLDPVLGMAHSPNGFYIGIIMGTYTIKGNWAA